jgi:hypothetical protein
MMTVLWSGPVPMSGAAGLVPLNFAGLTCILKASFIDSQLWASPAGVQGVLPKQAQRAAAGVAQLAGHLHSEGTLRQGHQGAVGVAVPGVVLLLWSQNIMVHMGCSIVRCPLRLHQHLVATAYATAHCSASMSQLGVRCPSILCAPLADGGADAI